MLVKARLVPGSLPAREVHPTIINRSRTEFRPCSAVLISLLKNTVSLICCERKTLFRLKNKLKSTDYKPDEHGLSSYPIEYSMLIRSTKHKLIVKLIIHMDANSQDKSIKCN
jgi:hypothetical protein